MTRPISSVVFDTPGYGGNDVGNSGAAQRIAHVCGNGDGSNADDTGEEPG